MRYSPIFGLACFALLASAFESRADTVVEDVARDSFGACVVIQGVALAGIKDKGADVEVLVNSPGEEMYLAKANMMGKIVMLSCEGARQKVWLVE